MSNEKSPEGARCYAFLIPSEARRAQFIAFSESEAALKVCKLWGMGSLRAVCLYSLPLCKA